MDSNQILRKLTLTYNKALADLAKLEDYKHHPEITKRTFAGCVAIFCHDDLKNPINKRSVYLGQFCAITGGPTIREHYCNWKSMSRGDAMKSEYKETSFHLDPRLTPVGSWDYDYAFNFCLEHVFAPINKLHYQISLVEPYFDDPQEDLLALKQQSSL